MNRYIAVVLLLQCFVVASKSDTINPANTTKVTWRETLPDYCGLGSSWVLWNSSMTPLEIFLRGSEPLPLGGWGRVDSAIPTTRHKRLSEKMMELRKGRRSVINDAMKHHGTIRNHPWQVAIIGRDDKLLQCGGSIISKYHVLTAAHCFVTKTPEKINGVKYTSTSQFNSVVAVGRTRYTESKFMYNITEVHIHDFYSDSHHRNDIALLKIDGEFEFTEFVWPICLPAENESYDLGRECQISGFGEAKNKPYNRNRIWAENVLLRTEKYCNQALKGLRINITEEMFCASKQLVRDVGVQVEACKDGHGGPLNCLHKNARQQVLLGITSFGHRCGLTDYPGVYTKVSKHLQWIRNRLDISMGNIPLNV